MKITPTLIDKLLQLRSGASIPASALRGEWVEELLRDGTLVSSSHKSRRTLMAAVPPQLETALALVDERLGDLNKMKELLAGKTSRAEQAFLTGNSKLVSARSCPGFPVNTYEPLPCRLNGIALTIAPLEGSFLFVSDWQQFAVPHDVTVVGIENMENFRLIRRQQALFSALFPTRRLLFVSRYPQSTDLRSWLQSIPNPYVHFGDFDLAGIHIFLTEFRKHLGERASYLVPPDIEARLQQGSAERYEAQYHRFRTLSSTIPSLKHLIALIHHHRRCYDQEGYIR